MLAINDPRFVNRAEIIREKGTNRSRFFRGQVDKYTWVDLGSSYLPSDILAAFLFAQLEAREAVQQARRGIWNYYAEHLADWASEQGVELPGIPDHCEHPYHLFYVVLHSLDERQALIAHLKGRGINTVFHYVPLHLSDMGRRFGGTEDQCPVTEHASDCLVRLPFFNGLTPDDQAKVVGAIKGFKTI